MQVVRELRIPSSTTTPIALAAGFFDGVHLGHLAVLQSAIDAARAHGGEAWVLTFNPHPMSVLAPDHCPKLLTTTAERLQRMRELGLDGCILLEFNREFAAIPPHQFLANLTEGVPRLASMSIGPNWHFGARGAGTPTLLTKHAEATGFDVCIVHPIRDDEGYVSSTRIREAILAGRITHANEMLGYYYDVNGSVTTGQRIGRELGFPTANVATDEEVVPPGGIYAGFATIDKERHHAVIYIGQRSTIAEESETPPVLEAHLLNFNGNLYDRRIRVEFLEKLREDQKFESREALVAQIGRDVALAEELLRKQQSHQS